MLGKLDVLMEQRVTDLSPIDTLVSVPDVTERKLTEPPDLFIQPVLLQEQTSDPHPKRVDNFVRWGHARFKASSLPERAYPRVAVPDRSL